MSQTQSKDDLRLDSVPMVCEGLNLTSIQMDAQEGFVISRIDGLTRVKDLIPVTGLGQEKTISILKSLYDKGVVRWRSHDDSDNKSEIPKGEQEQK